MITALFLKKCRQPLSSQSTICHCVYAIKVHNKWAKKRKEEKSEKNVHLGEDEAALVPIGLRSNKDLLAAQESVCKVRGSSQLLGSGCVCVCFCECVSSFNPSLLNALKVQLFRGFPKCWRFF